MSEAGLARVVGTAVEPASGAGRGGIEAFGRQWIGKSPEVSEDRSWGRYFSFSVDHKVIGIQYILLALAAGVPTLAEKTEVAQFGNSPSRNMVQAWIDEAKLTDPRITY